LVGVSGALLAELVANMADVDCRVWIWEVFVYGAIDFAG
jgi:hypothetical protein